MPRLTITLSQESHRALKETAARQGRTIADLIEESIRFRGYHTKENARSLVEQARKRSSMDDEQALALAVEETRALRGM